MKMKPCAIIIVAIFLAPVMDGCVSTASNLNRESLLQSLAPMDATPVPTVAELSDLRVPAPAKLSAKESDEATRIVQESAAESALLRARLAVGALGSVSLAESAWEDSRVQDPLTQRDLLLHRCLVEDAYARYPEMLSACGAYIDAGASSPAAATAVRMIANVRHEIDKSSAYLLGRGREWHESCRRQRDDGDSCADLTFAIATASFDIASERKEEAKAQEWITRQGIVRRAEVTGPYAGMARFQHGLEGVTFEPQTLPARTFTRVREPWDGGFRPGYRGERGLYRIGFDADVEGDVLLFVTSRTALRLVVDGQIALERRPRLRTEAKISRVPVHFTKGRHHFEIWVASYGSGDGVSLSALDPQGLPALVDVQPAARTEPSRATWRRSTHPGFVRETVYPGGHWAELDARLVQLQNGFWGNGVTPRQTLEVMRDLVSRFGYAPQVLVHAARAFKQADDIPSRLAIADVAPYRAELEKIWPQHPKIWLAEANEIAEERPAQALATLKKLVEVYPNDAEALRAYLRLASEQGILDEAKLATQMLLNQDHSLENLRALIGPLRRMGQMSEAAHFERRVARHGEDLDSATWASWLLSRGRRDEAVVELERICDFTVGHAAENTLWTLLGRDQGQRVLARMENVLAHYPLDHDTQFLRIDLLAAMGQLDEAKRQTEVLLERFGHVERYHLLAEELGVRPFWSEHLHDGDAAIAAWRSGKDTLFPGYPVVSHLEHVETYVTADLSTYEVRHALLEVRSEDALNQMGELRIPPTDRLLQLRVLKQNGVVLEPEHPPGVQDVSLTGLAVGDLIESVIIRFPGAMPSDFPSFQYEIMRNQIPARSRVFVLEVPADVAKDPRFHFIARGDVPAAETSQTAAKARWRVQWDQVPPLLEEPFALSNEEVGDVVGFSWANDFEHWALFRGALLSRKLERAQWLERAARRIAGDGPPEEKLKRLFQFVISEIEDDPSSGTSLSALATGKGYRNALLVALCQAVGLNVTPMALHMPQYPPLEVPTSKTFNQLGVRVDLPSGSRYVFADGDFVAFHALPPYARDGQLLDLTLDSNPVERRSMLPEDSLAKDGVKTQIELQWVAPDRLEGVAAISVPAFAAEYIRRGLRQASPKQLMALLEYVYGETFPGIRVVKVEMPNLEHPGHPLRIGAWLQWAIPEAGGQGVRVEPMFSQTIGSRLGLLAPLKAYLRDAERERDLFVSAMSDQVELQISLPDDAAWLEIPEKTSVQAGPIAFTQHAMVNNGTLYWKRRVDADNARIQVAKWPTLRRALSALVGRMDGRLTFWIAQHPSTEASP